MKEIPLRLENNQLLLYCKINGSPHTLFTLDTGCGDMVLSKEIADILFLTGRLTDDDVIGKTVASFGGHISMNMAVINMKKVTLGRVVLKNIRGSICDRYGGVSLLGMSVLNALPNYAIKSDRLIIDDGKDDISVVTNKFKPSRQNKRSVKKYLRRLQEIRDHSNEENYKFDYSKSIIHINSCLQTAFELLKNCKYQNATDVLTSLASLIKENIADDDANPKQRGAFITAYYHLYIGEAYKHLKKYVEAKENLQKAKKFFMQKSTCHNEIVSALSEIETELIKSGYKEDPVIEPLLDVSPEDDAAKLNLRKVDVIDDVYNIGQHENAYIGFNNFKEAHNFSAKNLMRLEVIQRIDGQWHRNGWLTRNDFSSNTIRDTIGGEYVIPKTEEDIHCLAKTLVENVGDSNKELIETIRGNETIAIDKKKYLFDNHVIFTDIILRKKDLFLDAVIGKCTELKWHDVDLAVCAIAVNNDSIAKILADDVLAGKYIPCAIGQMPEDFLFLADQCEAFKTYEEEGYKANNDVDKSLWMHNSFVTYDSEGSPGYAFRATYDNIHWRWEDGEHSSIGPTPRSHEEINKNEDQDICYWQIVRKPDTFHYNIIKNKAY